MENINSKEFLKDVGERYLCFTGACEGAIVLKNKMVVPKNVQRTPAEYSILGAVTKGTQIKNLKRSATVFLSALLKTAKGRHHPGACEWLKE